MSLVSAEHMLNHFLKAVGTQNCPTITQVFAVFSSPEGEKIELSNRRYVDNIKKKSNKHFPPLRLKGKRRIQIKPSKNNDSFIINVISLALAL